jgi:predicted nucleic acid-binding protein
MLVLDIDILIDVLRGHAPAVAWLSSLTELPSVPGIVVMELIQGRLVAFGRTQGVPVVLRRQTGLH